MRTSLTPHSFKAGRWCQSWLLCTLLFMLSATLSAQQLIEQQSDINPQNWPKQAVPVKRLPAVEARVSDLLSRMTIAEKVGQLIQADISAVTPHDVREFNLGSILSGGNSAPDGNLSASPERWLQVADEYWHASTDRQDGGVGIPVLWGIDAVHGHNNIAGATIYPHNIGLGASRNPELVQRISERTALAVRSTGQDWTFAPTLAVTRNDRWGRSYESYSEDSRVVANMARAAITGLQGDPDSPAFLGEDHVIATAKHFIADGGTTDGKDQGDFSGTELKMQMEHADGYYAAIAAGAQSVMASFSSVNGVSMHGHRVLLDDVLRRRMGFDGMVLGDWNGHARVPGCAEWACAESVNAGVDMLMVPTSWKGFFWKTLDQVWRGEISAQRLDQAVARVLRLKIRAGVIDGVAPSERRHAGNSALIDGLESRQLARQAVRQSLVLLKNEADLLPLSPSSKILVTGPGADDLPMQMGGWTLSWQGDKNSNADFPQATSIYEGIRQAVRWHGGSVELSADGHWQEKPDVAVVVYGEKPYSEFFGDRDHVAFDAGNTMRTLARLHYQGIPVVSVFLSGRPLEVNAEMHFSSAFVAAWLPGSEAGNGIADVFVGNADGSPRYDFTGKLPFSWPKSGSQAELNVGDDDYDPAFAYGYGLDYVPGLKSRKQPDRHKELLELSELFAD